MERLKQVAIAILSSLFLMTIGLLLLAPILGMLFNDELAIMISTTFMVMVLITYDIVSKSKSLSTKMRAGSYGYRIKYREGEVIMNSEKFPGIPTKEYLDLLNPSFLV
ncbi:Uncharacterised protein [uncultured Eubacterium sp.]|nr:Uncharacterised protein [uncultured Eubacterium sp.]